MNIKPYFGWIIASVFAAGLWVVTNELPQKAKTPLKDKYVVATLENHRPFSYLDEQKRLVGFDVEMAKSLCKHLELNCVIEPMPLSDIVAAVKNKEVDIVVAGLWESEERRQYLAFSKTYHRSRSIFISNSPSIAAVSPENAKDLIVGVLKGSPYVQTLQNDFGEYGLRVRELDGHQALLQALKKGEINVMLQFGLVGYDLLKSPEGQDLHIAGWYKELPAVYTEAKMAVSLENKDLLDHINDVLLHFQATGEYQEIARKYFPFMIY